MKIISENREAFEEIERHVQSFRHEFLQDIETIEKGPVSRFTIVMKESPLKYWLPPCRQITMFEGYIGFYTAQGFVKILWETTKAFPTVNFYPAEGDSP